MKKSDFEPEVLLQRLPGHINFYHNLKGEIENAMMNWLVRTEDESLQSFARYIRDKADRYKLDHKIITVAEWEKLPD